MTRRERGSSGRGDGGSDGRSGGKSGGQSRSKPAGKSAGKSGGRANSRKHSYPRAARISETVREVVAEELVRIDDDRLAFVTVTSIDVDSEMNRGIVYYDSLQGEEGDKRILEALNENRKRLQSAIANRFMLDAHQFSSFVQTMAFVLQPALTKCCAMIQCILVILTASSRGTSPSTNRARFGNHRQASRSDKPRRCKSDAQVTG